MANTCRSITVEWISYRQIASPVQNESPIERLNMTIAALLRLEVPDLKASTGRYATSNFRAFLGSGLVTTSDWTKSSTLLSSFMTALKARSYAPGAPAMRRNTDARILKSFHFNSLHCFPFHYSSRRLDTLSKMRRARGVLQAAESAGRANHAWKIIPWRTFRLFPGHRLFQRQHSFFDN